MIGRYFKLKIFFHSSFIWYIFVLSAHLHGISSNKSSENFYEQPLDEPPPKKATTISHTIAEAKYCPRQQSLDIKQKSQSAKSFEIGEQEDLICGSTDPSTQFNIDNHPDRFLVFPTQSRQCLSGGLWSTPLPICAYGKGWVAFEDESRVQIIDQVKCSDLAQPDDDCSEYQFSIGKPNKYHQPQTVDGIDEITYDCMYYFNRPYYLSFIILTLSEAQHGLPSKLRNVSVLVSSFDIIRNFSTEAEKFQQEHFHTWYNQTRGDDEQFNDYWAVIELSAYTDRLRVWHSIDLSKNSSEHRQQRGNECGPGDINIFRILEARYIREQNPQKHCPSPPLIENTVKIKADPADNNTLLYLCEDGYVMTIAGTDEVLLSGVYISCKDGLWQPRSSYDLPVCREKVQQESIDRNDSNIEITTATADETQSTVWKRKSLLEPTKLNNTLLIPSVEDANPRGKNHTTTTNVSCINPLWALLAMFILVISGVCFYVFYKKRHFPCSYHKTSQNSEERRESQDSERAPMNNQGQEREIPSEESQEMMRIEENSPREE